MKISTRFFIGSQVATALSSIFGAASAIASSCIGSFYHPTHGYTNVECTSTSAFDKCICREAPSIRRNSVNSWTLDVIGNSTGTTPATTICHSRVNPHTFDPPKNADPGKWKLVSCEVGPATLDEDKW